MALHDARQDKAQPRQQPGKKAQLVDEYRKVGPAAINAALLCKGKAKRKDEPKRPYQVREEI
ncbi:hypothetical protein [Chelativorans intermedius]|uniref:Uncharacterized protein n=1 Tax=Chelativorans intermedius TaxID=515947 RepID=A0ABV6D4N0_9HYPH|nr:hypothetical protein [Chelativorans intermedius]MCT8998948.1 hypothetical protein [Chelativorans intermedius]